jgi:hypothetical protein
MQRPIYTDNQAMTPTDERVVEVTRRLREFSPLYEMAQEGIDLRAVAWKHAQAGGKKRSC